jgi:hypothetical protein
LATTSRLLARWPPRESRDSSPELAMVFLTFLPRLQAGSAARGFRPASRGPAFPVRRQRKGRRAQPVLSRAPAETMSQALCCWAELSPASPPPMARMIGGLRSALATAAHWATVVPACPEVGWPLEQARSVARLQLADSAFATWRPSAPLKEAAPVRSARPRQALPRVRRARGRWLARGAAPSWSVRAGS